VILDLADIVASGRSHRSAPSLTVGTVFGHSRRPCIQGAATQACADRSMSGRIEQNCQPDIRCAVVAYTPDSIQSRE
jgi:hypothetical protein